MSNLGGPKFSFGNRFDGIPFDHPALSARRQLKKKEYKQPEFRNFPSTVGTAPGTKFNPPRSITAIGSARELGFKDPLGPGSHDPIMHEKVPTYIMAKPQERPKTSSTA